MQNILTLVLAATTATSAAVLPRQKPAGPAINISKFSIANEVHGIVTDASFTVEIPDQSITTTCFTAPTDPTTEQLATFTNAACDNKDVTFSFEYDGVNQYYVFSVTSGDVCASRAYLPEFVKQYEYDGQSYAYLDSPQEFTMLSD